MFKFKTVVFLLLVEISIFTAQSVQATEKSKIEPSSVIPEVRNFELNSKVNPCDDFHQYVCSNVESQFKLRDDRSAHTFAFDDSDERILEKKKDFFKIGRAHV